MRIALATSGTATRKPAARQSATAAAMAATVQATDPAIDSSSGTPVGSKKMR